MASLEERCQMCEELVGREVSIDVIALEVSEIPHHCSDAPLRAW
jgi:hypothetical protein